MRFAEKRAVALRYKSDTDDVPKVVAKGEGSMAERIKDHVSSELEKLKQLDKEELLEKRYDRLMSYGNE